MVLCQSFHPRIGTIKIGIPIYDATKWDEFQFPFRNTGNPATIVIIVDPTNPNQAVNGWKGAFQGIVSRETPCAFIAAWNRM